MTLFPPLLKSWSSIQYGRPFYYLLWNVDIYFIV